jgi:hypothetical protein
MLVVYIGWQQSYGFARGPFLTCPLGVKLSPGGEILCSPLQSSKR